MNLTAGKTKTHDPIELDSVFEPPEHQDWIKVAEAGLGKGCELENIQCQTLDGIPIQALYDTYSCAPNVIAADSTDYWDNRLSINLQDNSCVNSSCVNSQLLSGLSGGATSIELHLHSRSALDDCLSDVKMAIAPVSLRANMDYVARGHELASLANSQAISNDSLRCSFNADPLGVALKQGGLEQSVSTALEAMAAFAAEASDDFPQSRSVLVDAAIHHNAGATPVDELHAAIATAMLYMEHMRNAGLSLDAAQKTMTFQLAMDADTLIGIAKLRALRALWNHVLNLLGHADKPPAPACVVAETSQRYLTINEPWNNHLRNLAASTAACMAGSNAIIVHRHDKLSNASDIDTGQRLARNIPVILERECGLQKISDPMGGSYAIENLTHQLMQHTWQSLVSMDNTAQWLLSLEQGEWQQRLAKSHQRRLDLLLDQSTIMVGVNRYVQSSESVPAAQEIVQQKSALVKNQKCWAIEPLSIVRDEEDFLQTNSDHGNQP